MKRMLCVIYLTLVALVFPGCKSWESWRSVDACGDMVKRGFRDIPEDRRDRFLDKVHEDTALCRGGDKAVESMGQPWVDWQNYWATGGPDSRAGNRMAFTEAGEHLLPDGRGVDGALLDLEYQRLELIKFNLFDNYTYEQYVKGRDGVDGPALTVWKEMRLPSSHPDYMRVGGSAEQQLCKGELIRHRTLTGICNDIKNPLMGSTGTVFGRNVQFESTFPDLIQDLLARNRHGDRLGLLKPDPQVISRRLFTRAQTEPDKCNEGQGTGDGSAAAHCDYKKAPFFNVLAAFWIQFMTHDWFSHLQEGHNDREMIATGCANRIDGQGERPLNPEEIQALGCRPEDKVDKSYYAEQGDSPKFSDRGQEHLARSPKTTRNYVTAWWDASQIYGYDETSLKRVKHDPADRAKLLMIRRGERAGEGERYGYLPVFETCEGQSRSRCTPDPINPAWDGQEAVAFPDNWSIGLSFYHNLFVREHNVIVDEFRKQRDATPDEDSGLRRPLKSGTSIQWKAVKYKDVTPDELFEVTRLIVSAEIAKIHTTEWTPQLLYDEPLYIGMNGNWSGLLRNEGNPAVLKANKVLEKILGHLNQSESAKKHNQLYSAFASGSGIFGLGSHRYDPLDKDRDVWDLKNPDDVNGGVNHFGTPFNFPEEFISVYRLHPLVPDLIEYREWDSDPNVVRGTIPFIKTFRGKATKEMEARGLANLAVSMGRQRLGLLTLLNHPMFLQNLPMPRLNTSTNKLDVAALDILRDRERGVPRFNEFRRQIGLRQLTSFDDFVDKRLEAGTPERQEEARIVQILREVYGQHRCDKRKIITAAQRNPDGSDIDDCLGHPDGTIVDNIEDVDTVVGYLAEFARPHGFAISETQFHIFIINASRRLFSDRFFTSSFRPEFYTRFGVNWVNNNGPGGKQFEPVESNGHKQEVSPLKRVMLRAMPELGGELKDVMNVFDPWARDRGEYYSLQWKPRPSAASDKSFD